MSTEKFANNAQSNLTTAVAAGDTSLTVANASAFPASGTFRILIDGEILLVTAVSGNTFTVTRGAEGTTAAAHANAAYVTHVVTAAALLNCPRAMTTAGDLEYLAASGAVTRLGVGSAGQVLGVSGGLPAWVAAGGGDMLAALVNSPNLITNASANLTSATWNVVKATTGAVTVTVTLPAPSAGLLVGVRIDPASTQLVTLSQHATELIDGQASRVMWAGEKAVLLSDGANWFKVAGLTLPMVCGLYIASAGNALASGTWTTAALDSASLDNTGLMADTANHRIQVQRAGTYQLAACGDFTADAAGTTAISGSFSAFSGCQHDSTAAFTNQLCQSIGYASGSYVESWSVGFASLSAGTVLYLYGDLLTASGYFAPTLNGVQLLATEVPSW